ncbi:MAG: ribonuclease HII, partial [Treponema sp.]|nr:ribonuclease HII [Treponema sp.]
MTENLIICGMDEAGRGPLAGPVVAGAVILPKDFPIEMLNDSKKLSAKKRAECEKVIKEKALWGIGIVNHTTIDKINILQASLLAMKLAFEQLLEKASGKIDLDKILGLADGTFCPDINVKCECEVKADAKYPEVMAA